MGKWPAGILQPPAQPMKGRQDPHKAGDRCGKTERLSRRGSLRHKPDTPITVSSSPESTTQNVVWRIYRDIARISRYAAHATAGCVMSLSWAFSRRCRGPGCGSCGQKQCKNKHTERNQKVTTKFGRREGNTTAYGNQREDGNQFDCLSMNFSRRVNPVFMCARARKQEAPFVPASYQPPTRYFAQVSSSRAYPLNRR